jgi:hypothetical protein
VAGRVESWRDLVRLGHKRVGVWLERGWRATPDPTDQLQLATVRVVVKLACDPLVTRDPGRSVAVKAVCGLVYRKKSPLGFLGAR